MVYTKGLHPLITKPSQIRTNRATLIDHIYINIIDKNMKSGLVINDISDHLPVFLTYDFQMNRNREKIAYRYVRKRTEETIHEFRME